MKRLVILRGNSASGKTTTATMLQHELGRGTMLISQDVVRRQILRVSDKQKHPAMQLMALMAKFGWDNGYETIIIEGILSRKKNGAILKQLITGSTEAFIYYFDIPFAETVRRHTMKSEANEYGEKEMREWWLEADLLEVVGEKIIDLSMNQTDTVAMIVKDITLDPKRHSIDITHKV